MKFNPDGSLAVIKEENAFTTLKALSSIPFSVGKQTAIDFLAGDEYNKTVEKHNLQRLPYFGIFEHYEIPRIKKYLLQAEEYGVIRSGKLLEITPLGTKSLAEGMILEKIESDVKKTIISDEDRQQFAKYEQFLRKLTDEQKKAVISTQKRIACIAGAGTGKTTVLTKRIAHLVKHLEVAPEKILAITFTRKARLHMHQKLQRAGITGVHIHTFNSFSEQLLRKHETKAYSKTVRIITFAEKMKIADIAFEKLGFSLELLVNKYYAKKENRRYMFVQDCFSILDFYNNNNEKVKPFYNAVKPADRKYAEIMYSVVKYIQAYMSKQGLRDFSDQIKDTLRLFKEHPETKPHYAHILIDEYQDVNEIQIDLVESLAPKQLFCVGDPRQSIYGWRGSKVEYIQKFSEQYPDAETIFLTKNFRSGQEIVTMGNKLIGPLRLPALEGRDETAHVEVKKYEDAAHEAQAIAYSIAHSKTPRNEIFVIARTNKQLQEIIYEIKKFNIPYTIKSDEVFSVDIYSPDVIVLATAHCVKGLEAEDVYVVGCTSTYFPCYGSEHKILDFIKDYYDKREEELRVLYVAVTRAKKKLQISYYGKRISPFLKDIRLEKKQANNTSVTDEFMTEIRSWRASVARQQKIPAFLIISEEELKKIATERPLTLEELKKILPVHKAHRYGKDILRLTTHL